MPRHTIDISKFQFSRSIDVRWADFDMLQHVNNAVYFTYLENARIHYLQEACQWNWSKYKMVIANIDMDFVRPIEQDAKPEVLIRCIKMGNSSFVLENVIKEIDSDIIFNHSTTVLVAVNERGESISIPDEHRKAMQEYDSLELV